MAFEFDEGYSEDFDFEVGMAYFGFRAEYNNGQALLLVLEGQNVDTQEDKTVMISVGQGWAPSDDASFAIHHSKEGIPDGKTQFSSQSYIARFLKALIELGAGPDLEKHTQYPNGTGADTYVGMRIHLETVEVDYGKEIGKKRRLLPTGFNGYVSANGSQSAPQTPPANVGNGGGNDLRSQLVELAKSSADHATFSAAAFQIPGVTDDSELVAAVANPSGLFAEARNG